MNYSYIEEAPENEWIHWNPSIMKNYNYHHYPFDIENSTQVEVWYDVDCANKRLRACYRIGLAEDRDWTNTLKYRILE